MTVPVADLRPVSSSPRPRRHRHRPWLVAGVVAAATAGFALFVGSHLGGLGGSVPSFPLLAAHPDRSLHGTVVYYANDTGCLRLVAASGQASRTLWCLPKENSSSWPTVGKPAGPQLVWRADGRLEVTMFRFKPGPGKGQALSAGWQKVIDVRTGEVHSVPTARVPSAPTTTTEPAVNPAGQRVSYTLDGGTGHATVTLTDRTGSARTLLSVHGPGEYGYRFGPVFWAPNWQWIAASDDSRILVITPGTPSVTRVLVTGIGDGAGGGTAGPTFAVTSADLLTSTSTLVNEVKAALDAGNPAGLAPLFARSVDYAIAASGSFGTISGAKAAPLVADYLSNAHGPWNFTPSARAVEVYRHGPYARYLHDDQFFGTSREGRFIAIRVNRAGKIDQVFLAANTNFVK